MQTHREAREDLSSPLETIDSLEPKTFPFEKWTRDRARFDIQVADSPGIGILQQMDVERTPESLTLEVLVYIEAIDVAVLFQLDEANDHSIAFGDEGQLDRQSLAPMRIIWWRGGPCLEFLGRIVLGLERMN